MLGDCVRDALSVWLGDLDCVWVCVNDGDVVPLGDCVEDDVRACDPVEDALDVEDCDGDDVADVVRACVELVVALGVCVTVALCVWLPVAVVEGVACEDPVWVWLHVIVCVGLWLAVCV